MLKTRTLIIASLTGLCLFFYALFVNKSISFSGLMSDILKPIILVGISLVLVDILSFVIVDVLLTQQGRKQRSDLLQSVVRVLLYVPFVFIIFRVLGKDLTVLAATSTLLGAVLGFALQTPLGNFLSGISLRVHQPFNLDDYITINGERGCVVDFDWRTTTLRVDSGAIVKIPNGAVETSAVHIITSRNPSYCMVEFSVPAQLSPHQVETIVLGAVQNQLDSNINGDHPLYVRMANYSAEEITYNLAYVPKQQQLVELHTNPQLRCRLWYALGRAGVRGETEPQLSESVEHWLAKLVFFQGLSPGARQHLQEQSKILLFDRYERISQTHFPPDSMLLVTRGGLLAQQQLLAQTTTTVTVRVLSHRPKTNVNASLPPWEIDWVAQQLAEYLGPAAYPIVNEMAAQASSLFELYQNLATLIDSSSDREAFLFHQPPCPTELFQSGDSLGEMTLFLGEPWPNVGISTAEETEILAITPFSLKAAIAHDGYSMADFSQRVANYYEQYLATTLQALEPPPPNLQALVERIQVHLEAMIS